MSRRTRTSTDGRPAEMTATTALQISMVAWPRELNPLVASYASSTSGQLASRSHPTGAACAALPGAKELISGVVDALLVTNAPDCRIAPNAILYSIAHAMAVQPTRFEGEGAEVIDIRDQNLSARPGFGNSLRFPAHTDMSYSPVAPELMAMHVLSAASGDGGDTLLVSADQAAALLDTRDVDLLLQPNYWFDPPSHYAGSEPRTLRPILQRRSPSGYWVRFRHDGLRARDGAAQQAADRFAEALASSQVEFKLPERSVLIIDNGRVLHGRTEFTDRGSSAPRHLKRMYMSLEPADGAFCD